MSTILKHGKLGEIHGVLGDDVVQFLGIQYASLKDRFAKSEILDRDLGSSVIDATRIGPMVMSPLQGCDAEFGIIQHALPKPDLTVSELHGLNLNVTVPLMQRKLPGLGSKLPVCVFIHGGGYSTGSNSWPQYSQARMVKLSADMGFPMIGVGINYRLGLPGFLTSSELREAGYASNNGLRDQINALRWIKKNIGDFAGDADNVTVMGESAGAVSGMFLLHSEEPLFKRLISMSGSALLVKPLPLPVSEFLYASLVKSMGLENLSGPERVKAILEIPIKDLLEKIPPTMPLMPVVDGDIIPGAPTFSQISDKAEDPTYPMPGKQWCESLMIGDCQFDGSIFSLMLGPRRVGIAQSFHKSIEKSFAHHPSSSEKLFQAYGITPDLPDNIALRSIFTFATDIGFLAPVVSLARGWPGKAYVYHFNEPNPWDGEWKGDTTHVLDIAFLFQNFNEFLPPAQKEVAVIFARDFIKFVNGEAPWAAFGTSSQGAMVYGPSPERSTAAFMPYIRGNAEESCGRNSTIFKLGEDIPLDELATAWGDFLAGQ